MKQVHSTEGNVVFAVVFSFFGSFLIFLDVIIGVFLDVIIGVFLDVIIGIFLDVIMGVFLDVIIGVFRTLPST